MKTKKTINSRRDLSQNSITIVYKALNLKNNVLRGSLVVIFTFISFVSVFAQEKPNTTRENLDKHNLEWTNPISDFDHRVMTVKQIDEKISLIIKKAISDNTPNTDIKIPINYQKLKYHKHKFPTEMDIFGSYTTWNNDGLTHLNQKSHFYTYDEFIFSTENDEALDQKNVYYAIRSIIILKERYPEIYTKLFVETKQFITENPPFTNFSNLNKGFWIAFNRNPEYMASNNTVYLAAGFFPNSNPQIGMWKNIAVVNIHSQNILGQSANGSKPVYNKENSWANYELYMTEGLLVSIAHEMTHNYIDYAHTAEDNMFRIRLYRGKPNFIFAEESAVVNTTYQYFSKKGGLLSNQPDYYYRTIFEPNIVTLTKNKQINAYSKAFSDLEPTPEKYKTIFQIPIFK